MELIRGITDRNARGVEQSRQSTEGLRQQVLAMAEIASKMGRGKIKAAAPPKPGRGRPRGNR
ncbi:MAG: hypothetical protein K2X38_14630 [Gemmataceae bacterium]|nr:hypothetical protein [Gemmataceae bacterium]